MLSRGVFLELDLHGKVRELGRLSEITQRDIAIARAKQEYVRSFRVVLDVCDYLGQLLNIIGLEIDHLISECVIFQVPQIDAEVI